jgi:hypothetical protein
LFPANAGIQSFASTFAVVPADRRSGGSSVRRIVGPGESPFRRVIVPSSDRSVESPSSESLHRSSSQRKLGSILIGCCCFPSPRRLDSLAFGVVEVGFVPLSGGRVTSLDSGHPAIAPALLYLGHPCPRPALQDRESAPGFSTVRPCTGENARASGNCSCVALPRASMPSPARAPSGLIVPASLASEGPHGRARASCAQKRGFRSWLSWGPVWSGGGPEEQPRQRARAGMRASSAKAQGCASPNPGGPTQTRAAGRVARGVLSLGYFSLDKHCAAGAARTPKAAP